MSWIAGLLDNQPLFALFLTIAIGYIVGEIPVAGFSLGSGAVLFVGLAIGAIAPRAAPPALVGSIGLLLFLYGIGVGYGAHFFRGLTSVDGLKANAAALTGLSAATLTTLAIIHWIPGVGVAEALGAFAGAGTSTATLQAAIASLGSKAAAVGYSVAYPFGVVLPIVLLNLYNATFKPTVPSGAPSIMHLREVVLRSPSFMNARLDEAKRMLPAGVAIVAIRREHHNFVAEPSETLQDGDVLLIDGTDHSRLDEAIELLGDVARGRMLKDRADIDYLRVFASRRQIMGRPIGSFRLAEDLGAQIVHIRRGDSDMHPTPEMVLEFGDRVGMLAPRGRFPELQAFFGDSIKGTSEISYIAIGVGAALGLLVGMVPIPVPGAGTLMLGFAGLLLTALCLGQVRRTGGLNWTLPLSANLVLRNFGLTVFLAQVGMSSGQTFAATVVTSGPLFLLLGALIVTVMVIVTLAAATLIFRIPFDMTAGVVSGVTGNPAILAFASRIAPTDKPDIGYAMIFPSITIAKILTVQIAAVFLRGG